MLFCLIWCRFLLHRNKNPFIRSWPAVTAGNQLICICILIENNQKITIQHICYTPCSFSLRLSTPKFCISIVFSFSWGQFNSQEKLKTMQTQKFGVDKQKALWYVMAFLEWSIELRCFVGDVNIGLHSMVPHYSGAPARAKRARSGAPWVSKFGKPSIPENLVMT